MGKSSLRQVADRSDCQASGMHPQRLKLHIVPMGQVSSTTGEVSRKAVHKVVKLEIGGLKGAFADGVSGC